MKDTDICLQKFENRQKQQVGKRTETDLLTVVQGFYLYSKMNCV